MKIIRLLTILFVFAIFSTSSFAQIFSVGEELNYEVSYLGVRLGTIKIITENKDNVGGKPVAKVKAFIDSRDGIPFVSLHTIFESWIDNSVTFSRQFVGHFKTSDNKWTYEKINFDFSSNKFRCEKWLDNRLLAGKDFYSLKKWNDGMSLFFFARQYCNTTKPVSVPTIMDQDTVKTKLNFSGKRESAEVSAINYPVKCIYFDGVANWTGIYGLSGNFEGWFSDDDARVPIKAKMKVYVGSVSIELVSWKRAGWTPPKK